MSSAVGPAAARILRPEWEPGLRRGFHVAGMIVLLLYALPRTLFGILPREDLLYLGLAAVAAMEALRWSGRLPLPAMRPLERRRPASFVYFAIGIAIVIVLFPEPVAIVAIGGAALIDPLIGEFRTRPRLAAAYPWAPGIVYGAFAALVLFLFGPSPLPWAIALGAGAAVVALLIERPRIWWLDDDLLMTVVPAIFLAAVGFAFPVARIT
jgi:dolichol kinase